MVVLAAPIAAKMGLSTDEFVKQMYAHTATGDWKEFADDAVKLKWVDTVVGRCHETACIKLPDSESSVVTFTRAEGSTAPTPAPGKPDEKTRSPQVLPRLNPVDCYYLYNPDGYYRSE